MENPKAYSVRVFNALLKRGLVPHGSEVRAYGNFVGGQMTRLAGVGWYKHILGANDTVLFCAHTDTVTAGVFDYSKITRKGGLWSGKGSNIGADDKAGMAIICTMMMSGVSGHYVFFDGEEVGCTGSNEFVRSYSHILDGITHAIAFDRGGCHDVITHQGCGMTCSVECAQGIADLLNDNTGMTFTPCDQGILTDTLTLSRAYPKMECTNISVGYTGAHSYAETQDVEHMSNLAAKCVSVGDAWSTLPVAEHDAGYAFDDFYGDNYYTGAYRGRYTSSGSRYTRDYSTHGADLLAEIAARRQAAAMVDAAFWAGFSEISSKSTLDEIIENYPQLGKKILEAVLDGIPLSQIKEIEAEMA